MLLKGVDVSADSAPRLNHWRARSILVACVGGLALSGLLAVSTVLLAAGEDGPGVVLVGLLLGVGAAASVTVRWRLKKAQTRRASVPALPANRIRFCRDPRWSGRVAPFAAPRPPRPEQRRTRACITTHPR